MIMNLINFSPNMMNFDLKYSKSPLSHPSNKKNPQQQPTPTPKFAPPPLPLKKKTTPKPIPVYSPRLAESSRKSRIKAVIKIPYKGNLYTRSLA